MSRRKREDARGRAPGGLLRSPVRGDGSDRDGERRMQDGEREREEREKGQRAETIDITVTVGLLTDERYGMQARAWNTHAAARPSSGATLPLSGGVPSHPLPLTGAKRCV